MITKIRKRDGREDHFIPERITRAIFLAASKVAKEEGFTATDDNMLAEHVGFQVKLVDCGTDNIKITTPADLAIAEVILRRREK